MDVDPLGGDWNNMNGFDDFPNFVEIVFFSNLTNSIIFQGGRYTTN